MSGAGNEGRREVRGGDPAPLTLVAATANPDKAAEIREILGAAGGIELLARPAHVGDVDETGATLEENARLKAVALADATGIPAIADDTGIEVDALDGAPGVRSARYAGADATYADNVAKLLNELAALPDHGGARRARFRTVALVRFPDGREVSREGVVDGTIIDAPRGDAGFGYDPVFVPDEGDGRTFAELRPDEKHAISHRGRAFRALAEALRPGRAAG
ncbi:MAG TPA: RdgB/HAM1 family non-canonical purine NTP pyrophosphatase [Acidimicrobiales bacterium]|nr:RdgB/HAM1 family non-canonical purine NTP pyrophosphatase [Acidimicrobiales bacterium]